MVLQTESQSLNTQSSVKNKVEYLVAQINILDDHRIDRIQRIPHLMRYQGVDHLQQFLFTHETLDLHHVRHFVDHVNEVVLHIQFDFLHFDLKEHSV